MGLMSRMLSTICKSNSSIFGLGLLNMRGVRRCDKMILQQVQSSRSQIVQFMPKKFFSIGSNKYIRKFVPTFNKNFIFVGCGIGVVLGISPMLISTKPDLIIANESEKNFYILDDVPISHPVSRSVKGATGNSGLKMTIYQFQTCPFCCKVRAYLDYYGYSYDIVEVNSVSRKETKWSNYKKVPFLIIEQENSNITFQLKDSSMIISALHSLLVNKDSNIESIVKAYPILEAHDESGKVKSEICNKYAILYGESSANFKNITKEKQWRQWTDDVYVHMLSPNIYRTMSESFQAFSWFRKAGQWEDIFSAWENFAITYFGAPVMYLIGWRLKKRYHLQNDVRLSLYEESLKFIKLTKGTKFIGGQDPNLSDLSIYGVLSAIEGCDAFKDLLHNVDVEAWYYSMKKEVENHNGKKLFLERFPIC